MRRFLRKSFHRTLLLGDVPDIDPDTPIVVFMNHPSWWDPMLGLFLADRFFGDRDHYAPIDSQALQRYGILKKLGFFGIDTGRPRGAKQFLDAAGAIMADGNAGLWLTPQGEFRDPRMRPVVFKPGLAHLASRLARGVALPLAVEYPFWDERTPVALAAFGAPIELGDLDDPGDNTRRLQGALTEAQDRLAAAAVGRDPATFTELLGGRAGIGGVYDLWRRARAKAGGETFSAEHGSITSSRPS